MASEPSKHENATASDSKPTLIKPVSILNLIDNYPDMRPVVIEGILRRGETCNIIAAAKIGKTYLVYLLAWCIVTGIRWLSHNVTKGRVLIIDNELHPETLASRLDWIANKLMINRSDYENTIDVITLRGQNIDIHAIEHRLDTIEPGTYSLVIFDALYRTLPKDTSENDNAAMMHIYNKLDYYASPSQWDCAIAVVHHASKGAQGDKAVTDVGAGAGSISRAADTHIIIRQHNDPELSVMECVTRSFKSPDPVSIRFDCPLWEAVDTEPAVKRLGQRSDEKRANDDAEADKLLMDSFCQNPGKKLSESQLVRLTGLGPSRIARAVGRACKAESVQSTTVKRQGRKVTVYTATATATATA